MSFKEKVLREELKMYLIDGVYRVYGNTFKEQEEIKELGGVWNDKRKIFEFSKEQFDNLDILIQQKVLSNIKKQKCISLEKISKYIMEEKIKLYLKKGEYIVYGKTKEISKDLFNLGFSFVEGNFQIEQQLFIDTFDEDVKVKVLESNIQRSDK